MNIILFDDNTWQRLLPLTYTRPVADIRIGILTIKEKWQQYSNKVSFLSQEYLKAKYSAQYTKDNYYINGSICPTDELFKTISCLKAGEVLKDKSGKLIALKHPESLIDFDDINNLPFKSKEVSLDLVSINHTWDIFSKNAEAIAWDFKKLTSKKTSAPLNETNTVIDASRVFVEQGAKVNCSILNPDGGYIYIGQDAEIMEGSIIRGSLALCKNAVLKLGAKIYGATTIGPYSKVGGEVNNSVIQAYSNKGHDGFMGNTVIGQWCNIGADTNTSNLKNNYASVRLWDYNTKRFADTGLQFCGLVMGDHSKCAINTMFNTGTVVGVGANIFGAGFPKNFIPSFSWGSQITYKLPRVFEVAEIVMSRRNELLDGREKSILEHVFETTKEYRTWENK